MMAVKYTETGAKSSSQAKLPEDIFGVIPTDHKLLQLVYTAYLSNRRSKHSSTKTRGEVSGGGKKPWRQKGTGRARVGSSRNPIWRHGGIVFGPTGNENFKLRVNKKAKSESLRQALSIAAHDKKIIIIENFESKNGKVSDCTGLLKKMDISGNILLVVENRNNLLDRATRNIKDLKLVTANYLNTYDILNADSVILIQNALDRVVDRLGNKDIKQVRAEV